MKRVPVILVATASTLLLSAASWRIDRPLNSHESHLRSEVVRLRAHFDSVDTELRMRDVSHLSVEQRASRIRLIAWLREYRNAGRFPQNDRFPNRIVPFFRDSQATLCAMAYLVDRSGRGDIVDHIANTRNNAYIRDLTDDQALVAWLGASGLSVSEAARIQPSYEQVADRVSTDYALVSMGLGGSSLGTIGVNLFSPSRISGGVGVLAGAATIVAGVVKLEDGPGTRKVAIANTAIGSVAALAGLRALYAMRGARAQTPAEPSRRELVSNATIAPDLIVTPSATMLGLRVQARF